MGNTTNTLKTFAGAVTNITTNEDQHENTLPDGDKYFGFINVRIDMSTAINN